MTRFKWPIIIASVALAIVASCIGVLTCASHTIPIGFGNELEARFETLPPDDQALTDWLKRQPGVDVAPYLVEIHRLPPDGKLLRVFFYQQRTAAGHPPLPDLDGQAAALGYAGQDAPFRWVPDDPE